MQMEVAVAVSRPRKACGPVRSGGGVPILKTKAVTAGVLASLGDVIAQRVEGSAAITLGRTLTMMGVNVFYIVPILSFFYAANEEGDPGLKLRGTWGTTAVRARLIPASTPRS